MIMNRLVVPEGNNIRFFLDHRENGEKYTLKTGEQYYIMSKLMISGEEYTFKCNSDTNYFDATNSFKCGSYPFEIGIDGPGGKRRVILPAYDDRSRPLNELVILRRLEII